ncbi:MAG: hypothetical protein ACR652_25675 [Methylocystis sp.]|uniref:hypothetical protein n=1 Tax=Methylocystis sp. TaxID=1911079 RepID=UPI003DA67469
MQKPSLIKSVETQDQLLIQRQLGDALRGSFEALTLETLPDQVSLLLLQLALAELIKQMRNPEEGER